MQVLLKKDSCLARNMLQARASSFAVFLCLALYRQASPLSCPLSGHRGWHSPCRRMTGAPNGTAPAGQADRGDRPGPGQDRSGPINGGGRALFRCTNALRACALSRPAKEPGKRALTGHGREHEQALFSVLQSACSLPEPFMPGKRGKLPVFCHPGSHIMHGPIPVVWKRKGILYGMRTMRRRKD